MSPATDPAFNLSTSYKAVALYFHESDSIEYIRRDVPRVYRRIDEILTLVLDMRDRSAVGFRLKGFKNFYLNNLRSNQEFLQNDFLLAVSVLEKAVESYGDKLFSQAENAIIRAAYRKAWEIAHEDNVEFRDLPQVA